jgi:hypothetical protein
VCGACGYCSSDRICLLASAFCCGNVVLKLVIVLMFDAHACAYRDIPYLALPCLALPSATYLTYLQLSVLAFPFPQALYRKRHFSDGPPILVAYRLPSLPERCTSLHRSVAALRKLWQLLAVPKLRVQHQSRREDPGKRQPYAPSPPHAVVTIV